MIVYVVVVDLSKPSTIIDTLNFWLGSIRDTTSSFFRKSSDIPAEDREYVRSFTTLKEHEDQSRITPVNIPTIVIGNKYDLYEGFES
eukprot:CAMPEP_0114597532 /NCGR_PEP_ID=MMETSP0125-20121206/19826_1 /TAXON_ID=485358 ORGANISM="Aristerostoma sp., Strain ATCC 50986" /NCGR_SAMPLE_ID=MMETSP0125 /ASSEMBLY_ACC=CAM_ASM_000245 /LENGTH=86 /DNA_ID=CAMNT_0001802205 /DNA_START=32 /DNA_END=289 /DNA_ORIENTATION=+